MKTLLFILPFLILSYSLSAQDADNKQSPKKDHSLFIEGAVGATYRGYCFEAGVLYRLPFSIILRAQIANYSYGVYDTELISDEAFFMFQSSFFTGIQPKIGKNIRLMAEAGIARSTIEDMEPILDKPKQIYTIPFKAGIIWEEGRTRFSVSGNYIGGGVDFPIYLVGTFGVLIF